MSQPPPDWMNRQRGPRIGCADVTIVSIASITAFVILIFVLFRPDFAKVVDVTNRNGEPTVSAVRATETPIPSLTRATGAGPAGTPGPVVTTAPAKTAGAPAAPPTVTPVPQPTPSFRIAETTDECRLRQDTNYKAVIIQVFKKGSSFKIYAEQRYDDDDKVLFYRVETNNDAHLQGWMVSTCFNS